MVGLIGNQLPSLAITWVHHMIPYEHEIMNPGGYWLVEMIGMKPQQKNEPWIMCSVNHGDVGHVLWCPMVS